MGYKNGTDVLPTHLLEEIQSYFNGGLIYIPKSGQKVSWGEKSGTRKQLDVRNRKMQRLYQMGNSIEELACEFFLSPETVKKIVYGKG